MHHAYSQLPLELPLELWRETFRVLDRHDWMRLRYVCQKFNSVASQLLFSSIRIFITNEEDWPLLQLPDLPTRIMSKSWEILDCISRDPKFAAVVRVMNVYAFCDSFSTFETLCLANALRKLPYLHTFRWLGGPLEIPPIVVESITVNLSSLVSLSEPSRRAPLAHLRHLYEITFYVGPAQCKNQSIGKILLLNAQSLRKLTLPSYLCDAMPAHLLDNLTHLDLDCDPRGAPAMPLCHLPRLESLSLQSNSAHCERELIKSLPQDANALPNLVSLRLQFDCETLGGTHDLLSFIRNRRKLKRLYLDNEGLNDLASCQFLFSLFQELSELQVLGLNPCHILLPEMDAAQTTLRQLGDVLPQDLKALHIGLPAAENALFDYDSTFVNGLGCFKHLTYINVIDDDDLLLFVPSEVAFDNPHLQFIGHNGRNCDVQHSLDAIDVVERPKWMFGFANREDFVDEDHMWLWQSYITAMYSIIGRVIQLTCPSAVYGVFIYFAAGQIRKMTQGGKLILGKEVATHNSRESCWIIVHGKVYDVTDFLDDHPGGSNIILKYAGKDATREYEPIHPPDAITNNLPPEKHLGAVNPKTVEKVELAVSDEEKARQQRISARPPLGEILNLHDFEAVAKAVMSEKSWAYYSSAADDEITNRENHLAYHRIWFRPRVLRDVSKVDWSTTILGHKSSMPIYITATALGKLGHPDGELNLTRAAAKHGVIQMIPTLASCSFDELVDAAQPGQVQFFQLYVNKDRNITQRIVQHAERRGIKALFITVDAPQLGRREKDMRMKFEAEDPAEISKAGSDKVDRSQGAARAISSFIDPGLNWSDIDWFKSITKVPLILKGVQCWEDALEAFDRGLAGVVLSNHGGRQLDFARSGIEVLVEVVTKLGDKRGLKFPNDKFHLFVDGGVRRATDVLKAIALGATAVGIGRPFLYAFSAYGLEGVDKALEILCDEFEMNMRLLGAKTINDVVPQMVDASNIHSHIVVVPNDRLYNDNYQGLQLARLRDLKAKL
ncbi:hypothetical protein APHAL10511_004758 [Amanita phalloides]|nr:hypothetical protein APHAL10511_004758 [Amanita phalloides]